MKTHQGKFVPRKPEKYVGDPDKIYYRSSWELAMMVWCENNTLVKKYSSEETQIPYICDTDGKMHTYYMDFKIWYKDTILLVEIKPKKETKPPKRKPNKLKFLTEQMTYIKNSCKWRAAKKFAEKKGYLFQVWTEDTLKTLKIIA